MSGRRLALVHNLADDLGPESSSPNLASRSRAVSGFASFYITGTGWEKIPPGRLEIAEIWGGASGIGNAQAFGLLGNPLVRSGVEFYINLRKPSKSFVATFGTIGDVFTFGFFGKKY